jgi:hypothetical protein
VRIIRLLALGVVFAVNGCPLFGDLTRGQPQPEAEKMRCNRVQVQRPVSLMAVQKHRHADHGDVGHAQGKQDNLPPSDIPKAVGKPVKRRIKQDHRDSYKGFAAVKTCKLSILNMTHCRLFSAKLQIQKMNKAKGRKSLKTA